MALPVSARQYYYPKLGSYKNLTVRQVKVPQPRANEVLVKVHAVSLQFRDLIVPDTTYPVQFGPPDELVPCSDMAGEIVAMGEDVKGWEKGDRVCANLCPDHLYGDTNPDIQSTSLGGQAHGVLTEYRTFPAHGIVKIPTHMSYEEASTLPCAALTAYNALHGPVPIKAGDYVLVLGTGGVSIAALQFAVASGATVIATSSSDEKLKIASRLGASFVVNYRNNPNWGDEVRKFTKGVGVDHVIEVGGYGTLPESIKALRTGGWLQIVGFVAQDPAKVDLVALAIRKAFYFRGISIGSVAQFLAMNRLITANPNATKPLIDKVFDFEEALQAFAYLKSQAHVGKIVVRVSKA